MTGPEAMYVVLCVACTAVGAAGIIGAAYMQVAGKWTRSQNRNRR